jgi:hypothetical protein
MKFDEITIERLRLVPFDENTAFAVLAGDLESINAGEGWRHKGTIDGLSMADKHGEPPGWMVTLDEPVIGDCGTHGDADETGAIEIGYGLAEPFRGRTYGTELVGAMTEWLLAPTRDKSRPRQHAGRQHRQPAGPEGDPEAG